MNSLFITLGLVSMFTGQTNTKPDVVMYIADDGASSEINCYGNVDAKTPHIDNFAIQGARLTNAYQGVSTSSASRYCLFTGLYPQSCKSDAKDGTLSIVHQLHPLGYKVALVGSSNIGTHKIFPWDLQIPLTKKGEIPFEAISQFINDCAKSTTPYCLIVAGNQQKHKGDKSQWKQSQIKLPSKYQDTKKNRRNYIKKLARTNYMDQEFGKILQILDKHGNPQKTCTMYLSEPECDIQQDELRNYDASKKSACIVRWPKHVSPNTTHDAIVEYVDVLPTILDIIGIRSILPVDGKSFKNVLLGKTQKHRDRVPSTKTEIGTNCKHQQSSISNKKESEKNKAYCPVPLYTDPFFLGAADPEVVWNKKEKCWWMFYTNRRTENPNGDPLPASSIGVATSKDWRNWSLLGYIKIDGVGGLPNGVNVTWAPGIVCEGDTYHMFLTFKKGNGDTDRWGIPESVILHLTAPSNDLLYGWKSKKMLHVPFTSIDASLVKRGDTWNLFHRGILPNQKGVNIFRLTTKDLNAKGEKWVNHGPAKGDVCNRKINHYNYQEAPYTFYWKGYFWMFTDHTSNGFPLYRSEDCEEWTLVDEILKGNGKSPLQNGAVRHPGVVIVDDRAFLFYFNQPYKKKDNYTCYVQIAELFFKDGNIYCDRNAPVNPPKLPIPQDGESWGFLAK